ncbi:hypothetical protein PGT21_009572 [Puccinia graminis f. sp. tritici]|uniref:Uncharacterized protein n=1 Tax=Puccinia graminis f. sp. tritici TaxID=56615 RepID=A0A5B0PTD9_PUCGR|nr:hypothetical protein PGT21_009572 [Puccinia graminis f. sp. tritici]KAA1103768.1 hypothetical protein PGTUg99_001939 [Puccinia graminis f. sp. tritici]
MFILLEQRLLARSLPEFLSLRSKTSQSKPEMLLWASVLVFNYVALLIVLTENPAECSVARLLKRMDTAIESGRLMESEPALAHTGQHFDDAKALQSGGLDLKNSPPVHQEATFEKTITPEKEQELLNKAKAKSRVLSRMFGINEKEMVPKLYNVLRNHHLGLLADEKYQTAALMDVEKLKMRPWKYKAFKKFINSGNHDKFYKDVAKERVMIKIEEAIDFLHPDHTKTEMKFFKKFLAGRNLRYKDPEQFTKRVEQLWVQWKESKHSKSFSFKVTAFGERVLRHVKKICNKVLGRYKKNSQ